MYYLQNKKFNKIHKFSEIVILLSNILQQIKKRTTATTKPYPTKWGPLHGPNYAIISVKLINLSVFIVSLTVFLGLPLPFVLGLDRQGKTWSNLYDMDQNNSKKHVLKIPDPKFLFQH